MEIWNDEFELTLEEKTTVTFEEALKILEGLKNQRVTVEELYGTDHDIRIDTDAKIYLFNFGKEELKKIRPYLKKLNGGRLECNYWN